LSLSHPKAVPTFNAGAQLAGIKHLSALVAQVILASVLIKHDENIKAGQYQHKFDTEVHRDRQQCLCCAFFCVQ